jgi:hypothetical protein
MRRFLVLAAAIATAAPLSAQPTLTGDTAPDYSKNSSWLCLPGRPDVCSTPLATTELDAAGYGAKGPSSIAKDPPIDCFYVYPTVSNDPGLNSDLNVQEEKVVAQTQFARFASVCRTFSPIYRQMTIGAIAAYATGVDITQAGAIAYGDVAAAWRAYIATRNQGRPFVLIGHSQGSLMVQQLISREIENNPTLAGRMKLAIIPGFNVLVPLGKLVGGTFKKTPLCSREGETECVMSWTSFRDKNVPPSRAMFGVAGKPGMTVGCVNPGRPGAVDWVPLDSYWYTHSGLPVPGGPIQWSTEGEPPTAYVHSPGLVSAHCVNDGERGYLSVRTNHNPGDKRTDRIGGEVAIFGMFLPGWGMHLADMSEGQGDLIREVGKIASGSTTIVPH